MKLLIVDDNANWRKFIRNIFEDFFTKIYECEDGSQAVTSYAECKPEWVFMDIRMKTMDGLKAAKKILSKYPLAKIIIVTSYESTGFRDEALQAGVLDYVIKDELDKIFEILKTPLGKINKL